MTTVTQPPDTSAPGAVVRDCHDLDVPHVPEATTSEQVRAARSLVEARQGLIGLLLYLAEQTAGDSEDHAIQVLSWPLAALGESERAERAAVLAELGHSAYGTWFPGKNSGGFAEDELRAAAGQTARRVIDTLRIDACLCRTVTR
jgi:hypothetical protein